MKTAPIPEPVPASPSVVDHLRPYQKRDYRDVLKRCEAVRSVLYVAFMGSGKTVLASALIKTWAARGERILILTHTREILRQTHDKLAAAGIVEDQIGWIWLKHRTNPEAAIQLASLDTLVRRDLPKGITRIVIDEAHHATAQKWRKILEAYPKARVLGLTGTPVRLDGEPLGTVFEEMIESEPTEILIEQGFIARPTYWTPVWHAELSRRSGRDFSDADAAKMMSHSRVLESMVEEYSKHAAGLPALGFAATREKAIQYAAHFTAAGIPADTLFGSDTDLKRQGTLARLRKGALRVLWTCNVLGEGWDYPGLRCVMLARPTLSDARYLQQVARCMRPGDPPVVLDLWGAWSVFDPPWADFGWSLNKKARRGLHVGERGVDGEVTWTPPFEDAGELRRADASMRMKCSVCPEPATKKSAQSARYHECRAYCAQHTQKRNLPLLSCAVCGRPATYSSSKSARDSKRSNAYCAKHIGGPHHKVPTLPCVVCGKPAVRGSSQYARRQGGKRAYCAKHSPRVTRALSLVKCTVCGKTATRASANRARTYGTKSYCAKHAGGLRARIPRRRCVICGELATVKSSWAARHSRRKAYCARHRPSVLKEEQRLIKESVKRHQAVRKG